MKAATQHVCSFLPVLNLAVVKLNLHSGPPHTSRSVLHLLPLTAGMLIHRSLAGPICVVALTVTSNLLAVLVVARRNIPLMLRVLFTFSSG